MKKLLLVFLTTFCIVFNFYSQNTAYKRQPTYKFHQYTGTRQSYVDALVTLGLDSLVCSCYFNAPNDLLIASSSPQNGEVLFMSDDYVLNNRLPSIAHTLSDFYIYYTEYRDSSIYLPVLSIPTRSLNTNFTISSSKSARVNYSVRIEYLATISDGCDGSITLQYSLDSGSSWIDISTVSVNLDLGTNISGHNDYVLSGYVPINALVRLNSNGTNTINSILSKQQEITNW